MELYMVTVKERLERTVPVEASNEVEAVDIVYERYRKSGIVLDTEDFTGVDFIAIKAFEYERELVK